MMVPTGYSENALHVVTEEMVRTPLGREDYHRFLKSHPDIVPVRKLFGLSAPLEMERARVHNHAKKILLWVHPDKVSPEERQKCTEIAQIVTAARDACTASGTTFPLFASNYEVSPDLERFMTGCIEDRKWTLAKKRILQLNISDLANQERLAILCMLVLIQTNDLKGAIECSEIIKGKRIKETLTKCQKGILDFQFPPFDLKNSENLFDSFKEMMEMQTFFEEKLGKGWLPRPIVPHTLHMALKNCYHASGNQLLYEMHLRKAIRLCSYGQIDEKRKLIGELVHWIGSKYKDFPIEKINLNTLCSYLDAQFQKCHPSIHQQVKHMLHFPDRLNDEYADQVCQALEVIIQKKDWYNYYVSPFVPDSLKPSTDHYLAYPNQTIEKLKELMPLLRATRAYQKGEARLAASCFSEAKAYFQLGLMQIELGEYRKAVVSFGKLWNNPHTSQSVLVMHLFTAMNLHDTTCPETPPLADPIVLELSDQFEMELILAAVSLK